MRSNLSQDIGDFIFDSTSHSSVHRQKKLGLNFINIIREAFMHEDLKCIKMTVKLSISFTFLAFISIKAERKMLIKLTLGLNVINVLRTAFMLIDPKNVKRH